MLFCGFRLDLFSGLHGIRELAFDDRENNADQRNDEEEQHAAAVENPIRIKVIVNNSAGK